MEDSKIVDLYWERSENAIAETDKKYRNYCYYIAFHILHNQEDSDECVNDTYLNAWNAMPTQRPMKEKRLLKLLGSIDEKYIDEAKPSYSNEHQNVSTRRIRRIPAALVAAVIAVSLMGVVAVAAVYGSNTMM